ncbi:MAG: MBL fold metallo-hydrolase [Planctomycetia bacterium]|nr:MBL fold metallo-hydrolase [Planctomycetia bacterium]
MLFRLIYDDDLAQASYLIGCQRTGEAIVFDPERDIDRYLDLAASQGLRIVAAAETHIHADFLSGVRQFAMKAGARAYVSGEGGADWQSAWVEGCDHRVLRDGDTFEVGNIRFTAVHSPGHTPEHLSFLVTDLGGGADTPMGVVTGDFVFVGDLGRPDLLESAAGMDGMMEPSARTLAASARGFLRFDDHLQVWPAHGSGSACGKALGAVPQSTVGYERRFNHALSLAGDEQAFVDHILAGQPEPPAYFARMKAWNRDGVPVLESMPDPETATAGDLAGRLDGIRIVDVRDWTNFREGHLPGAIWTKLGINFLMTVGSYVEPGERIGLVAPATEFDRLVRDLVRIGLDDVAWVATPDTLEAYREAGGGLDVAPEIDAETFRGLLEDGTPPRVLDVRRIVEWNDGHLENAINVAHTRLIPRLAEVPADETLYVHCAGGVRSAMAVSELRRRGVDAVNVAGGWAAMRKAGCGGVTCG